MNEEYKIWKKNTPFLYGLSWSSCLLAKTFTSQHKSLVLQIW